MPNFWQTLGTLWTKPTGKPTGDMDISIVNSCTVEKTPCPVSLDGCVFECFWSADIHFSRLLPCFLMFFDAPSAWLPNGTCSLCHKQNGNKHRFCLDLCNAQPWSGDCHFYSPSICMLRMLPIFLAFLQCPNCFLRIRFCGFLGQVQRDVIEQQLILVFFPSLSPSLSLSLTFFRSIVQNVCVCVQIYQT